MSKDNIPNSLVAILFSAILLGAVLVRVYKLNTPLGDWHSWRQADTASVTYLYLRDGIDLLHPRYFDISTVQTGYPNPQGLRYVEFPLFNIAHIGVAKIVPSLPIDSAGRLVSIFAALSTSIFLYVLANKLWGRVAGLMAMAIYSFLPFNVFFTRVVLPDPLGVMFLTGSVTFFAHYLTKPAKKYLILSATFMSLSLLIKPVALFFAIIMVFIVVNKHGIIKSIVNIPISLAIFIALIPLVLWRGWINYGERFIGAPHFSWMLNGDGIRFKPAFWYWIFGERVGNLISGVWLTPFIALGAIIINKKTKVLSVFLLGSLLYLFVIATANVRHDYYQIYIIPTISLLAVSGIVGFWEIFPKYRVRFLILLFVSIISSAVFGWYSVRDFYKVNNPSIVDAGSAVQRLTPEDSLVVAPYNGDTAFLYQTKRFGWPVVELPIEELIGLGADYYVSTSMDNETNRYIARFETVEKTSNYIVLDLNKPL